MGPDPTSRQEHGRWHLHLKKRFLHEAIFGKPSENRDFILSLPPDLAYNIAQLWIHFDKAEKVARDSELIEHGERWCDYLRSLCEFFDKKKGGPLYAKLCKPWQELVITYSSSSKTATPLHSQMPQRE